VQGADDESTLSQVADEEPGLGLNLVERGLAGIVGVVASVAGGIAVFRTDNQAGTTALLLLGAVFLLLAVQGTAVRRANKDSLELDKRTLARKIAHEAERALSNGRIDDARNYVEGAIAGNPEITDLPEIARLEKEIWDLTRYEAEIRSALLRVAGPGTHVLSRQDSGDDWSDLLLLLNRNGDRKAISVVLLYYTGSHPARMLNHIRSTARRLKAYFSPALLITNFPITDESQLPDISDIIPPRTGGTGHWLNSDRDPASSHVRLAIVTWMSPDDDTSLRDVVETLA
jgi:hypothetical protein